jgi:hypothetical protein
MFNVKKMSQYTDFSKAFDRIDHQLLLHKLDRFGLSDQLICAIDISLYE